MTGLGGALIDPPPPRCACDAEGKGRGDWCAHCEAHVVQRENAERAQAPIARLERTSPDPWKHRSDGMKCSTCIWYVAKNGPAAVQEVGRCRRHAPTMSGYPVVFPVDWCGDHKLSEVRP